MVDGSRWTIDGCKFVASGASAAVVCAQHTGRPDIAVKIFRSEHLTCMQLELQFLRALHQAGGVRNSVGALCADILHIQDDGDDNDGDDGHSIASPRGDVGATAAASDCPGSTSDQASSTRKNPDCARWRAFETLYGGSQRIDPDRLVGMSCLTFPYMKACLVDALDCGYSFAADTVMLGVARGCQQMLRLGFVHLDVKVDNVLLRRYPKRGGGAAAAPALGADDFVLCDYGAARRLPRCAPESGAPCTLACFLGGSLTAGSSPPEAFGHRAGTTADVFSLGVLHYAVLEKGHLFGNCDSPLPTFIQHVRAFRPSHARLARLQLQDIQLISKCVRENPTRTAVRVAAGCRV